jgi:hypothetical protein
MKTRNLNHENRFELKNKAKFLFWIVFCFLIVYQQLSAQNSYLLSNESLEDEAILSIGAQPTSPVDDSITEELGLNQTVVQLMLKETPNYLNATSLIYRDYILNISSRDESDKLVFYELFQNSYYKSNPEMVIYNHNGKIIYLENHFRNQWDGKNQQGEKLACGMYSYRLKISGTNNLIFYGYLEIIDLPENNK